MSRQIANFIKKAVNNLKILNPERIILFGSQRYGVPSTDSDIDLLIVWDGPGNRQERYSRISQAIGDHVYPLDIVIRTSKELRDARYRVDPFLHEVLKKGKVLYATKESTA